MKALICTQCGGRIDPKTNTCEYCGTKFKVDNDKVISVETYTNPVVTLASVTRLPMEQLSYSYPNHSQLVEYSINRIAEELAHGLIPYIKYSYGRDMKTNCVDIHGEVKVVIPVNRNEPSEMLSGLI